MRELFLKYAKQADEMSQGMIERGETDRALFYSGRASAFRTAAFVMVKEGLTKFLHDEPFDESGDTYPELFKARDRALDTLR